MTVDALFTKIVLIAAARLDLLIDIITTVSLLINATAINQFNILNLIYIGYYLRPEFLPFGAKPLFWAKRSIEDGYKSYELP